MDKNYSFENYIMQCCKAREWNLRKFLKNILIKNEFRIIEDDYESHRGGQFSKVHNMLAIRGNPRTCLVAHTDVCRDHMGFVPDVNPVIKLASIEGSEPREVIQDANRDVQVGGDDRLGVAINSWIALNTGYDVGLLFTTDEEVGAVSAEYAKFPELLDFDILLQVDRGNHSHQLVTSIGGVKLCSREGAATLIKISEEIGLPRYEVSGMLTDVLAIKTNNMCKDAVNMTCGYHNSYGADSDEFIDIQEARDTMKYVASIVKHYDLEQDIKKSPMSRKQRRKMMKLEKRFGHNRGEDLFSEEKYDIDKNNYYRDNWTNFIN